MKKIMYALIIFLIPAMCSCGSHRSNTMQETSIESSGYNERKDTVSVSEQIKKTEDEDTTEEMEEITTVYDTSKPVDPVTGKSPVLSETKKNTKKETGKKKTEDSNKVLNQSSAEQRQDDAKITDKKEEDKKKDETTVPKQIGGMFWALAALVALMIVGWLVYRCRNK